MATGHNSASVRGHARSLRNCSAATANHRPCWPSPADRRPLRRAAGTRAGTGPRADNVFGKSRATHRDFAAASSLNKSARVSSPATTCFNSDRHDAPLAASVALAGSTFVSQLVPCFSGGSTIPRPCDPASRSCTSLLPRPCPPWLPLAISCIPCRHLVSWRG